MKILIRVFSAIGFIVYSGLIFLSFLECIPTDKEQFASFIFGMYPLAYFVISFATTFGKKRSQIKIWGIIAHLLLLVFNIVMWIQAFQMSKKSELHAQAASFGVIITLVPSLFFTILWLCMYFGLDKAENQSQERLNNPDFGTGKP